MKPTPKVAATGIAGAATVVVVYIAGLLGLDVPATVASALTIIFASGAGYIKS